MKLPGDQSVFNMLSSRLNMLGTRQKSIAENVANANTPGYVPKDVDLGSFERALSKVAPTHKSSVHMFQTQNGHMTGNVRDMPDFNLRSHPDSEVTRDGNAVVVEEQMMRLNEVRTDFETAIGLYQKGLSMLRIAIRKPE